MVNTQNFLRGNDSNPLTTDDHLDYKLEFLPHREQTSFRYKEHSVMSYSTDRIIRNT